ncbi:MAG TPA: AraC family transcriptional regulator ligand-binding domain-containing protein [Geminicoccus sp.]|uniref:AraC family transcriptional regulator n=1 Tax=Geminicoccus sp. TaxID=2024832 RepID=UPI002E328152|nr:AraC family transcriptional regulator ligand-binding domain-containing protein [Geminicoccus sp.]HEX2527453.1 AraC family transcriptional regulator ligand-binding domain-containing protein [Geminicoccus sp.]
MWDRSLVRLALVHMLPGAANRIGVPLAPLLTRAGLPADETFAGDGVASRAQICALLQGLAERAGNPTIGLDLAAAADPGQLGLAGHALFAGRTLRECLVALARQMPALQGGVALRLDATGGVARWSHHFADSDAEHARVLNEGVLGFMVGAFKAIAGVEPQQLSASMPHRARAPARIYEDKLGTCTTFGTSGGITLTFDAKWLDRPSLLFGDTRFGNNPWPRDMSGLAPGVAWLDDDALVAALFRMFEGAALSGSLYLVDTARSLGLSPRTLQRRLAGLGTSFEAEVDAWRHQRARIFLLDASIPVASVGRALGYRHPAHFVRAFRRWEGQTPLAYRTMEAASRPATGQSHGIKW